LLEANGKTVKEVIEDIDKRYPGFKLECIERAGKLYGFLEVTSIRNRFPDELSRKVADKMRSPFFTVIGGG